MFKQIRKILFDWIFYQNAKYRYVGYRYNIIHKLKTYLIRHGDPIVFTSIGNYKLAMNMSHTFITYWMKFPLYDRAVPRICNYLSSINGVSVNIIDVGANIGDTAALIKSSVDNCRILCVEGSDLYVPLLKKNFAHDENILIIDAFCTDIIDDNYYSIINKNGTASIVADGSGDRILKDLFLRLDDIYEDQKLLDSVDLLKIDTDGFDYKVLRGARQLLINQQPFIFFELDKYFLMNNDENIMCIFEFLKDCNYGSLIVYDNFGYMLGLYSVDDLHAIENIINYMYFKELYIDILVIPNGKQFDDLYAQEKQAMFAIRNG